MAKAFENQFKILIKYFFWIKKKKPNALQASVPKKWKWERF